MSSGVLLDSALIDLQPGSQLIDEYAITHGGEEVKQRGGGDGFFTTFPHPDAAIACAVAIQRTNRVHACTEVGDLEEADRRLEELNALVDQTGLPQAQWALMVVRIGRLILSGDLARAEALNDESLEFETRIANPHALASYGGTLAVMRMQQGRVGEIADFVVQAAADNPAIATLRSGVVAIHCVLGRLEEARALFEPDMANGFVDFPRDLIWTTAMKDCADHAVEQSDHLAPRRRRGYGRPQSAGGVRLAPKDTPSRIAVAD